MKIGQYQEVYSILTDESIQPIDKACAFYAKLNNMDFDTVVSDVPIREVLNFFASEKEIKPSTIFMWYRIGWRFYRLNLNANSRTEGDIISIKALAANEESLVENLHKIMSIYTVRKDRSVEHYEKLALKIQKHITVGKALALTVFFCQNLEDMRLKTLKRLTKKLTKITSELKQMKSQPAGLASSTVWQKVTGKSGTTS
jgi:hypothetical protein